MQDCFVAAAAGALPLPLQVQLQLRLRVRYGRADCRAVHEAAASGSRECAVRLRTVTLVCR